MATKKKLLQAAAGQAGGAALNVEDVFSTYLYTGNSSTNTITNNIDLSGEGGMVWLHGRSNATGGIIYDTERGVSKALLPHTSSNPSSTTNGLTAFNSDGFTLTNTPNTENFNGYTYASWTLRKAPKFFDVVTYTGNGTAGRTISHNLGGEVGCMIIKKTSSSTDANWAVYHRKTVTPDPAEFSTLLNSTTAAFRQAQHFNDTEPTSTEFTLGSSTTTNGSGETYVAYLFAHNDGDGGFGPDGDADIIKCGSYTGNGSTTGPVIDLGFEPQWILIKRTSGAEEWLLFDTMRGIPTGGYDPDLRPAQSSAENTDRNWLDLTSTGFQPKQTSNHINGNGENYIYIAIRRGPMAVPESATDVFAIDTASGTSPTPPLFTAGFPVDMYLYKRKDLSQNWRLFDRMRGDEVYLKPNNTEADDVTGDDSGQHNDLMTGIGTATYTNSNQYQWMWRRAPGYFDCIAYTGSGTPNNHAPTLTHNLGVVPEMIWVKKRNGTSNWAVVVKSGTGGVQAYLDLDNGNVGTLATTGPSNTWSDYFTSTQVIGDGGSGSAFHSPFPVTNLNVSGNTYIMYLFATLDGVSKVGSYTGTGDASAQTIDCGFSSGARMVIIKCSSHSGQWYIFDADRGITSTVNDGVLMLNLTNAESPESSAFGASIDAIQPDNSGFKVQYSDLNTSGRTFIFYAIA